VYGPITAHLAIDKLDEELRNARERHRLKVHGTQRSLVVASLLLSRRQDGKYQRPVPSEL
jgi:hypothetical protein